VSAAGPFQRDDKISIYLRDPDGVLVEITARNPDGVPVEYLRQQQLAEVKEVTPDMKLVKFDHASPLSSDPNVTHKFLDNLVGLESFSERANPDQEGTSLAEVGSGDNPGFLKYLTAPDARTGMVGKGNIHHIAVAVEEDEDQLKIKRKLDDAGVRNSGVIDRFWFKSLYFRDPDYNLLEVATKKPGYGVDEPPEKLGTSLVLPKWLEGSRGKIVAALKETDSKGTRAWPPKYEPVPSPPESLPSRE
jgi:catechol 2,3-dioxygenase-like lactoylglutathione lyase family enzyme